MNKINIDITAGYKATASTSRRARYARNGSGWLALIPLPLGLGLNIGTGFSGFASVRSWGWARYDHADHIEPQTRWAVQVLQNPLPEETPTAKAWEDYTHARNLKRWGVTK